MSECRPSAVRAAADHLARRAFAGKRAKKSTIVKGTAAGARALWMML
jgi:hypothetical protein